MYNAKSIQDFMDKVHKEAEQEAQKVYDKYNGELLRRIQNQIKVGDTFSVGMGVAIITNKDGKGVGEKLSDVVGAYWNNDLEASFNIPGGFNKTEII